MSKFVVNTFVGLIIAAFFIGATAYVAYFVALAAAITANLWKRPVQRVGLETQSVDPTLVVTLVHGTWARGAAWTRENSTFRATLRKALPDQRLHFESFDWSGRNTIGARYNAGLELKLFLSIVFNRWTNARHLVVCHSHGGSVVMTALQDDVIRERLTGVVFMSTPFLVGAPRHLSLIPALVIRVLPALGVLVSLGLFFNLTGLGAFADRHEWAQFIAGSAVLAAVIFAVMATPRKIAQVAGRISERLQMAELQQNKVLIVRSPGDEASAALGAAQILNFALSAFWDKAGDAISNGGETLERWRLTLVMFAKGWKYVCAVWLFMTMVLVLGSTLPLGLNEHTVNTLLLVTLALSALIVSVILQEYFRGPGAILLGVLGSPLPVLLALLVLLFGPELILVSLVLNVSAESTPPGEWVVHQASPPDAGDGKLRHSSTHDDPSIAQFIAEWIRKRLSEAYAPNPLR